MSKSNEKRGDFKKIHTRQNINGVDIPIYQFGHDSTDSIDYVDDDASGKSVKYKTVNDNRDQNEDDDDDQMPSRKTRNVTAETFRSRVAELQNGLDENRKRFAAMEKRQKRCTWGLLALVSFCMLAIVGVGGLALANLIKSDVPVGTVLAWLPKVEDSGSVLEEIPGGWVPCDGSVIQEGTWKGLKTPNLEGRFLKGGNKNTALETEEDMIKDHQHEDKGHSHDTNAHNHEYKATHADTKEGDPGFCDTLKNKDLCKDQDSFIEKTQTSEGAIVAVKQSKSNIKGVVGTQGFETRPKNMKVMWIIKCW